MILFKRGKKGINLAPETEKVAKSGQTTLFVGVVLTGLLIVTLVISLVFFFLNIRESAQLGQLDKELSDKLAIWQNIASVAQQSANLKTKAVQIKDLDNSNKNFKESLELVRKYVPSKVKLDSLTLKSSDTLSLQAISVNPAELYQFANELEKQDQYFTSVAISSLLKKEDYYILSLDLKTKTQ